MKLLGQKYFLLIFSIIVLTACTNRRNPIAELDTKSCVLKTSSSNNYFASIDLFSINGKRIDKEINFLKQNSQINSFNLCEVLNTAGINVREIEAISLMLKTKKKWIFFSGARAKVILHFAISKEQLSRIGTDEKLFFYSTLK